MNIENTINIKELATKAALANSIMEEKDAANNAELEAETAVLEAAIEAVKPVLRWLVQKLECRSVSANDGDTSDDIIKYFNVCGLVLKNGFTSTGNLDSRGGDLIGSRLVLLADGSLAQLTREGSWTVYSDGCNGYDVTMTAVAPREAMDSWKLVECIESMHKALQELVAANHQKAITAARARVAVLRAAVQEAK